MENASVRAYIRKNRGCKTNSEFRWMCAEGGWLAHLTLMALPALFLSVEEEVLSAWRNGRKKTGP